jgi:hypothetical protein
VSQESKGYKFYDLVAKRIVISKDIIVISNAVMNLIVPGFKIIKNGEGNRIDETYYKQIVGSLMYITATRPDMMFVMSFISRFMIRLIEFHLQIAKRALRYLKGTVDYGIFDKKNGDKQLVPFIDSDYVGDLEDRNSTSGYVFMLSEGAVSWSSKKQLIVTLSTTKAEFVAAAVCACQAVWMRKVLEKLNHAQDDYTIVMCDNNSIIKLLKILLCMDAVYKLMCVSIFYVI